MFITKVQFQLQLQVQPQLLHLRQQPLAVPLEIRAGFQLWLQFGWHIYIFLHDFTRQRNIVNDLQTSDHQTCDFEKKLVLYI